MKTAFPAAAQPIWATTSVCNQNCAFRTTFEVAETTSAPEMLIAADSDFTVWLNCSEIGRCQYPDFPWKKTFNRIPLRGKLRHGKNVIAVLVHHLGKGFSTGMDCTAYLRCAVIDGDKILAATSQAWKIAPETGWKNGYDVPRTGILGFSTIFDSRILPGWTERDYDDSAWQNATSVTIDAEWRERPVPPCVRGPFTAGKMLKCGTFLRKEEKSTPAETMYSDSYCYTAEMPGSAGADDGIFAIFDLGAESVGFLAFEIDAPEGAIIDYGHGEHLDDGIVRTFTGGRNFADRYIAHAGLNRHELLFHRAGLRYLQINISNLNGQGAAIRRAGIFPLDFPRPQPADFICDDPFSLQLRKTAIRTLEMCMHDHFEDCPWREQSKYSYDSRNQALYGYYVWGNGKFVKSSFQLIADTFPLGKHAHLMCLCAPSVFWISIPIFSFVWLTAARDLYMYTGDRSLFDDNRAMVEDILNDALSRQNPETGIYHTGCERTRWNFYEWQPKMDHWAESCPADEYHAAYNLYLLEMLENYAFFTQGDPAGTAYKTRTDDLRRNIHKTFWDPSRNAYASNLNSNGFMPEYHDHIQYLALRNRVVPDAETAEKVWQTLNGKKLIYATLSTFPYMVDALMPINADTRKYVANVIRSTYGAMLEKGATTLWETQSGAADFAGAGSLCHGWSSLPLYYQGAEILGVRPVEPGFKRFVVRPYADEWTHFAQGDIPTPHGNIRIEWQRRPDGIHLKVDAPANTEFTVESYPECPVASIQNI